MLYCDISDKTTIIQNNSKHFTYTSHKHRGNFSFVVKEYAFTRTDIIRIDYLINKYARDCYYKYFHTFKLRCLYDIEITNEDFVSGIFF